MIRLQRYPSKAELHAALASDWMALVRGEPAGEALSFALAGGTTPSPVYHDFSVQLRALQAQQPVRIKLVATDERWVPDTDPQSNEGLIASCFQLAEHEAEHERDACRLVSLKTEQASPDLALPAIAARLASEFPGPFSAVLLGMGADGHIASLFPGAGTPDETEADLPCLAARHPVSAQARISLSMRRLLNTQRVWLVITGDEKLQVLQNSEQQLADLPVARFLRAVRCEVNVYWSPD